VIYSDRNETITLNIVHNYTISTFAKVTCLTVILIIAVHTAVMW